MTGETNGLQESLDSFEAGCADIGMPIAEGIRAHIERLFEQNFEELKDEWEAQGAVVLAAARFAGRYAASYAQLKNSKTVQKRHANRGLREAQAHCQARVFTVPPSEPGVFRREWCRDVEIEDLG